MSKRRQRSPFLLEKYEQQRAAAPVLTPACATLDADGDYDIFSNTSNSVGFERRPPPQLQQLPHVPTPASATLDVGGDYDIFSSPSNSVGFERRPPQLQQLQQPPPQQSPAQQLVQAHEQLMRQQQHALRQQQQLIMQQQQQQSLPVINSAPPSMSFSQSAGFTRHLPSPSPSPSINANIYMPTSQSGGYNRPAPSPLPSVNVSSPSINTMVNMSASQFGGYNRPVPVHVPSPSPSPLPSVNVSSPSINTMVNMPMSQFGGYNRPVPVHTPSPSPSPSSLPSVNVSLPSINTMVDMPTSQFGGYNRPVPVHLPSPSPSPSPLPSVNVSSPSIITMANMPLTQSAGYSRPVMATLEEMENNVTPGYERRTPVPMQPPSIRPNVPLGPQSAGYERKPNPRPSINVDSDMQVMQTPGYERPVPPSPMDISTNTDFLPMSQQGGYVRSPSLSISTSDDLSMSQQGGYVRSPSLSISTSDDLSMSQQGGYVRSPSLSISTSNDLSMSQQGGYVRSPSLSINASNALPMVQPAGYVRPHTIPTVSTSNALPMSQRAGYERSPSQPDSSSITTSLESVNLYADGYSDESSKKHQIDLDENTTNMTSEEISVELKGLLELKQLGFVLEDEYERRKKLLLKLTPYSSKFSMAQKKSKVNGAFSTRKIHTRTRNSTKDRVVRVFLSSTFRDMQNERDSLVKNAFPKLKKICSERGIFFSEVDLRWGITEAQSESGQVLNLCLKEIDNCRPYFVSLLGDRYGYIPPIKQDIARQYPWLSTAKGKGVTELEIMYGALNDVSKSDKSLFFFKSKKDNRVLSADEGDNTEKLESLKQRIQSSGLKYQYYESSEHLAQIVLDKLQEVIEYDFPKEDDPDELELENMQHEIFADSRARVYIGRNEYYTRLHQYLASNQNNRPLIVTGESGSGKSSLLANWVKQITPGASGGSSTDFAIVHFIGSSPASAEYTNLLRRVMSILQREYDIDGAIPSDAKSLIKEFERFVNLVPSGKRVILVLDALNQLEDKDSALDMGWLPVKMPHNVKLIVSTLSNTRCYTAVMERSWEVMQVGVLNKTEKSALAEEYLRLFGKSFDQAQLKRIVDAEQTQNPLFLRALLEELRVHGVFEEINARIDYYLSASNVAQLYEKILARLENDYEKEKPGLVGRMLSLLWVSKRGLSESELVEVLAVTRVEFSPLFLALQENLTSRGGLLNFFHDYLRIAVEKRYLSASARQKTEHHCILGNYFEKCVDVTRKADELPWHLEKTENWPSLKNCVTDIPVFLKLYSRQRKFELIRYWVTLRKQFPLSSSYMTAFKNYSATSKISEENSIRVYTKVARFLREMLEYDVAQNMLLEALGKAVTYYGNTHLVVAKINYVLAELLWTNGNFKDAEPYCVKSLEIREKLLPPDHLNIAMSLCGLGELLIDKDNQKAKECITRAMRIRESHYGSSHVLIARCLQDLAIIADNSGDSETAISLLQRAIEIREKVLGTGHPHLASSLEALATTYKLSRQPEKAEPLLRRSMDIYIHLYGLNHPSVMSSCGWLCHVLRDLKKYEQLKQMEATLENIKSGLAKMNITNLGERIED
jgi:tetratricopeptide (TPR) repeat protein